MNRPVRDGDATGNDHEAGAAPARAIEWLRPRLRDVPDDLAAAVRDCVRSVEADDASGVPDLLARAATAELDRLIERPAGRATAVRLLAADAALTYAFEAAADLGADVPGLADRVGLRGRIGRRLAELGAEEEA